MVTLLETPNSATAWCIDRSGKVYNVYVHPFGSLQDDSLEDAAWLWCNDFNEVKPQCAKYYLATMWNDCDFASGDMSLEEFKEEIVESLEEIECLRGNANARKFGAWLGVLAEEHFKKTEWSDDWVYSFDLEELEDGIKDYLNNNILRVRFGSEFQTKIDRAGSLYFRISSDNYNWYNNILKFIDELSQRRKIVDITIEKDKESSGSDTVYVDHISLNDFLLNKPIVAESLKRSYKE